MKPSVHLSTSALLATALYAHSHSLPAAASCLVSGVLIDLDHVADFQLFSGEQFTVRNFVSWCTEDRWQKLTVVFHSYELLGILCAVAFYLDSAVLQGIFWGAGMHLLLDQLSNPGTFRLSPWFYFLGYRIAAGFKRDNLLLPVPTTMSTPE